MRLKVVTWNMNHAFRRGAQARAWQFLDGLQPDLALVQEAVVPSDPNSSVRRPLAPPRNWETAIVAWDRVALEEVPVVPLGEPRPRGHLESSHPGCAAVARATLEGGPTVMVASIYGMIAFRAMNGQRYAVTTVHRTLSDLTPILDVNRSRRPTILAGDLNVTPQIRPPDSAAHQAVLDRIKAFGLVDCLGATHEDFVQTHRHRSSTVPYQDDWIFASPNLRLVSCEPVDTEEAWSLSDHCPVVADFEL